MDLDEDKRIFREIVFFSANYFSFSRQSFLTSLEEEISGTNLSAFLTKRLNSID
jgi:hypothetical protein